MKNIYKNKNLFVVESSKCNKIIFVSFSIYNGYVYDVKNTFHNFYWWFFIWKNVFNILTTCVLFMSIKTVIVSDFVAKSGAQSTISR